MPVGDLVGQRRRDDQLHQVHAQLALPAHQVDAIGKRRVRGIHAAVTVHRHAQRQLLGQLDVGAECRNRERRAAAFHHRRLSDELRVAVGAEDLGAGAVLQLADRRDGAAAGGGAHADHQHQRGGSSPPGLTKWAHVLSLLRPWGALI
nr:hypothetical protein [Tepidimonas fonticaldi]